MPSTEQKQSLTKIWHTWKYFSRFTKPDRNYFLLAALALLGVAATNTIMIWLFGKPLDLLQHERYTDIVKIGLWFAV